MALIKCGECNKEISDAAGACPNCGFKIEKPSGIGCLGWLVIITGIAITWSVVNKPERSATPPSSPAAPQIDPVQLALGNVVIEKFSWVKGGFGSVMIASFTLTNRNAHPVRDLKIQCDLYGQSGTRVDRNTKVIYQVVESKKSIRIRELNMGTAHSQSMSTDCKIVGLTPH